MKMKFDIDWDTVEGIGTEYVKQNPMRDLLEIHSVGMILKTLTTKKSFMNDEWRVECFETVLKYILPEGEAHAFIAGQRQKHLSQIDLFN